MESLHKIYELDVFSDDPRFEGFGCVNGHNDLSLLSGAIPKNRTTRMWKVQRIAKNWKPVAVKGRVRPFNDYPTVVGRPAFSQRAVDALRDILEANGELLPLKTHLGSYWVYNLTTVADVLDWKRSAARWFKGKEGTSAMMIERFEFFSDRLDELSIFRIVESVSRVYVTERFVSRVQECGLEGFNFNLVWPLPPGVSWFKLASQKRRAHLRHGLPEGQSVGGNTIVIRLLLKNKVVSALERKRVENLMDELDSVLIRQDSVASPVIGNLEGFDYGVPGECRLFLSCADSDKLVKELSSWFENVDWPGGMLVIKRYGHYTDEKARTEIWERLKA